MAFRCILDAISAWPTLLTARSEHNRTESRLSWLLGEDERSLGLDQLAEQDLVDARDKPVSAGPLLFLQSNAWPSLPSRRTTAHAAARKARKALATQRIIRLLNGEKRRRPSVRPSELARARGLRSRRRGTARVYVRPRAARRLGRIRTGYRRSSSSERAYSSSSHPTRCQNGQAAPPSSNPARACFVAMLDPKSLWRPNDDTAPAARKAACGVEPRSHSEFSPS